MKVRTPIAYGDRIIIQKCKSDFEKRADRSGIVIPDSTAVKEKRSLTGIVKSVGEGIDSRKLTVGTTVYFARFSGITHTLTDDIEYLILREEDILATDPLED